MESVTATRTVYTVGQFLDWQRSGTLDLNPIFQRRPVWKRPAKSQLIDSIIRGYPIPIILLRQVQDLETLKMRLEVVDGQQRLRTLFSFMDRNSLEDFDPSVDSFEVMKAHNETIAGKSFRSFSKPMRAQLLGFELSTHILPPSTGDDLVFRIFARLNSTGLPLLPQEVRNAEFHGVFKSLVYNLSFEFYDYWMEWGLFSAEDIARMREAEAVSEYVLVMLFGIQGKSQPRIRKFYREYDDNFAEADIVKSRMENVFHEFNRKIGQTIHNSAFVRETLFYSLFTAAYAHMYGLGSALDDSKPRHLPSNVGAELQKISDQIRSKQLSEQVQDAMDRATADKSRRKTRHDFLIEALGLESS